MAAPGSGSARATGLAPRPAARILTPRRSIAGVLALAAFVDLAGGVADPVRQIDRAVLLWLRGAQSPELVLGAQVVSGAGVEAILVGLPAAAALIGRRPRWRLAAELGLVAVGAIALNSVLKALLHRPRPAAVASVIPGQEFGFPSGHAMVAAAVFVFLVHVTRGTVPRWSRILWTGGLAAVVLLIGLSRLYLGVHVLTDVLAGYAAGLLWADVAILVSALLARQRGAPAPIAAPGGQDG